MALSSYKYKWQVTLWVACAFFMALFHHPLSMTSRDCICWKSCFLKIYSMSFTAHTQLLFHGKLLALNTNCLPLPQALTPGWCRRSGIAMATCSGNLKLCTISAITQIKQLQLVICCICFSYLASYHFIVYICASLSTDADW